MIPDTAMPIKRIYGSVFSMKIRLSDALENILELVSEPSRQI